MSTRGERKQLQQAYLRYHSELDRVLKSTFTDLPLPFDRLIDAIDCEPALAAYIESCKGQLADDYDIEQLVDEVTEQETLVFGPLSASPEAATAEAYLIVSELARRRTKFHSPVFSGYGDGSKSLAVRFAGFKDEVFTPLVDSVTAHLDGLLAAMDTEDEDDPGLDLQAQLEALGEAVAALPEDQQEYAQLQADALMDELEREDPNERLVDVLMRSLQLLGGTNPELAEAVTGVRSCLEQG